MYRPAGIASAIDPCHNPNLRLEKGFRKVTIELNKQKRSSLPKRMARVIVGVCLTLSFFAPLITVKVSASRATRGGMACCIGKSSGHCSAGLLRKHRPTPKPEPMCGRRNQSSGDGITVVVASSSPQEEIDQDSAESQSSEVDSHNPSSRALHASFASPCHTDCCGNSAVAVRQPRPRSAGILPNANHSARLLTAHSHELLNRTFNSDEAVKRPRPRGPPLSI